MNHYQVAFCDATYCRTSFYGAMYYYMHGLILWYLMKSAQLHPHNVVCVIYHLLLGMALLMSTKHKHEMILMSIIAKHLNSKSIKKTALHKMLQYKSQFVYWLVISTFMPTDLSPVEYKSKQSLAELVQFTLPFTALGVCHLII